MTMPPIPPEFAPLVLSAFLSNPPKCWDKEKFLEGAEGKAAREEKKGAGSASGAPSVAASTTMTKTEAAALAHLPGQLVDTLRKVQLVDSLKPVMLCELPTKKAGKTLKAFLIPSLHL